MQAHRAVKADFGQKCVWIFARLEVVFGMNWQLILKRAKSGGRRERKENWFVLNRRPAVWYTSSQVAVNSPVPQSRFKMLRRSLALQSHILPHLTWFETWFANYQLSTRYWSLQHRILDLQPSPVFQNLGVSFLYSEINKSNVRSWDLS